MVYEAIDPALYKKILKIRTSRIPLRMCDLRNKVELFAVKLGIKPCFLFSRSLSENSMEVDSLKQVATALKLKQKITINPPLYCSRKPKVNSNFLKAFYNQASFEVLWAYQNPSVGMQIDRCLNGALNEGYVLGYPECCIKWHEEMRTHEVESQSEDIEDFMVKYPSALDYCQIGNEIELYEQALRMPYAKEKYEKVSAAIDRQLTETYRWYPYVPHWACFDCLEGRSKETEKLNFKYEKMLKKINPEFQTDFLNSVKQAVQEFEKHS